MPRASPILFAVTAMLGARGADPGRAAQRPDRPAAGDGRCSARIAAVVGFADAAVQPAAAGWFMYVLFGALRLFRLSDLRDRRGACERLRQGRRVRARRRRHAADAGHRACHRPGRRVAGDEPLCAGGAVHRHRDLPRRAGGDGVPAHEGAAGADRWAHPLPRDECREGRDAGHGGARSALGRDAGRWSSARPRPTA